jgi:hypothetical protein
MPAGDSDTQRDLFISYASEDRVTLVQPLVEALETHGYSVWFDRYELLPGDSLSTSIDRGLRDSLAGLVVLSRAFFAKKWTQHELGALQTQRVDDGKRLVPIWFGVTRDDVASYSPFLSNIIAIDGNDKVSTIIKQVAKVIPSKHLRGSIALQKAKGRVREGAFAEAVLIAAKELEQLFNSIANAHLGNRYFKRKKPVQYSIREWTVLLQQKNLLIIDASTEANVVMLAHFRNIAAHGGHGIEITRGTAEICIETVEALLRSNDPAHRKASR